MVGSDYDHVRSDRPRKRNVKVHDVNGTRLGRYPIQVMDDGYQLVWKGGTFPVRKGETGPEKGRFYLRDQADAQSLES